MARSAARIAARRAANAFFVGFCFFVTGLAIFALAAILYALVKNGAADFNFDLFTMSTPPEGERGGLADAIVGSLLLCGMGMVIALVIGILAGTWLAEYSGESRYGSAIRFLNDVLLSAPSILIGLFVGQIMVNRLIHHESGYAGGVALALLAIPVIIRTTEDVLRLQPISLRESGVALGTPMWTVIRTIIWRASLSGIVTGALLAFARISGETAPLIFTAGGNVNTSLNMYKPMSALPLAINSLTQGGPDQLPLAWSGALLISAAVLAVTIVARILSREQRQS